MTADHCGASRLLPQLHPGDRAVVVKFQTRLDGRLGYVDPSDMDGNPDPATIGQRRRRGQRR